MPEIMGVTNPVPGHDKAAINRNIPVSPHSAQLENVPDLTKVSHADNRTEQQGSDLGGSGNIRYDSNFQTFVQRLKETPGMSEILTSVFSGREGTVVLSGMQDGIAMEMAQVLEMLKMDEEQLHAFLKGQIKAGTRFGGPLFALLRGAYGRAGSEAVRNDILQFLKAYADHSSTAHIERNMLHNLARMADAMPDRWAGQLRELLGHLENSVAAGDRRGALQLLQKNVFALMAKYVDQTHDMGLPRQLLSMLALDVARYENGSEEKLLELFHQLKGYPTLKNQLELMDDQLLLSLLEDASGHKGGDQLAAVRFANALTQAAAGALRGEGSMDVQEGLRNLVAAMLVNESVYMPINHYVLPFEWEDRVVFSELWVDPDAEDEDRFTEAGRSVRILLKVDVQSLGLFDVLLSSFKDKVDVQIACPEKVAPFAHQIEDAVSGILKRNSLIPVRVAVRKMDRPVALTDVFPKIFQGRNGVDVKA